MFLVPDWQNIADWTQQRLTKANVTRNMDNHAGLQQAVLPKYWKVQAPVYTILQNIFLRRRPPRNRRYKCVNKTPPNRADFLLAHHTLPYIAF